jgi:hypothetical protein
MFGKARVRLQEPSQRAQAELVVVALAVRVVRVVWAVESEQSIAAGQTELRWDRVRLESLPFYFSLVFKLL